MGAARWLTGPGRPSFFSRRPAGRWSWKGTLCPSAPSTGCFRRRAGEAPDSRTPPSPAAGTRLPLLPWPPPVGTQEKPRWGREREGGPPHPGTALLFLSSLAHLSLRNNCMDDQAVLLIGQALSSLRSSNKNLASINLSYNHITDVGATHLANVRPLGKGVWGSAWHTGCPAEAGRWGAPASGAPSLRAGPAPQPVPAVLVVGT